MIKERVKVIENGSLYFLYRPRIGKFAPEGLGDVQRFYMVLSPGKKGLYRLVVVAEKRLPEEEVGKFWGYNEQVFKEADQVEEYFKGSVYSTKTVGERGQPSGRPAGEGVYAIVSHKDHTHLVYSLALPEELGDVQRELGIRAEGNFIISLINPQVEPPEDVEFPSWQRAKYPSKLQEKFRGRRFLRIDNTEYLDYQGSAFVLIPVEKDVAEMLGIRLETEKEDRDTAGVFDELRLEKSSHRIEPLFHGRWA